MLCNDVKRVVYFFLDGSLGDRRKEDFSQHLNLCPDCARRTSVHSRLRNFVQRRLQRSNAPEKFKTRLSRTLRAIGAEWS